MNTIARDNAFQYDSILETELSRKWISVFRTRVRERFYECKGGETNFDPSCIRYGDDIYCRVLCMGSEETQYYIYYDMYSRSEIVALSA